jgi:hypothetical protein
MAKLKTHTHRDYGEVIPPRGDDQPKSRNALSDAYCENYRPLQGPPTGWLSRIASPRRIFRKSIGSREL